MLSALADGRLFGSVTGEGRPVVLALHGWARTHRDFDAVLAPAGADPLAAIALDLPGFGATPPPPRAWGGRAYA
jgi:pimeloyl-ACP methyl ester carboxylesterase